MAKKKLLLIDDKTKFCEMVKQRLELGGLYEVTIASSGEEGIEQAKGAVFDAVITDFNMPGMNGGAVIDVLKSMQPALPVILMSVYHDDTATVTPDIRYRADAVVGKPINHERLLEALERVLARPRNAS